jgi:hypothetical protein
VDNPIFIIHSATPLVGHGGLIRIFFWVEKSIGKEKDTVKGKKGRKARRWKASSSPFMQESKDFLGDVGCSEYHSYFHRSGNSSDVPRISKVYFADPYAAWQQGTNENANGLLRQYFPKGIDFQKVSKKEIAFVIKKLNNLPRKGLN